MSFLASSGPQWSSDSILSQDRVTCLHTGSRQQASRRTCAFSKGKSVFCFSHCFRLHTSCLRKAHRVSQKQWLEDKRLLPVRCHWGLQRKPTWKSQTSSRQRSNNFSLWGHVRKEGWKSKNRRKRKINRHMGGKKGNKTKNQN